MNINDYVWVKLTPAANNIIGERTFMYNNAGNGWSQWQLWVLMQVFGEHIYMGNPDVYFEGNEISLVKPSTSSL